MKSVVGVALGVVGGVASVCLSILLFILYLGVVFGKSALTSNASQALISFGTNFSIWLIVLVIWFFIIGMLGLVFSIMLNSDERSGAGSIGCVVVGVLGVNLFLVLAGTLGIIAYNSYKKVFR